MTDENEVRAGEGSAENVQPENKSDEKVPMAPEVQARFNKLYGEAKTAKERASLLEAHTVKLQQATQRLQERLDASEKRDALDGLKSQLRAAREQGDDDKVEQIQEKLTELLVEEKISTKVKAEPKVQQPEINHAAVQLSVSEQKITSKWANEVDEDGELLRPWAALSNHPKSTPAADYLADLIQDEEYSEMTIKEKLALVDEKFGRKTQVKRGMNAVGEGSLTKPSEKQDTKLTPEEKSVAWKIFSKSTKEEAEKMYLEGKKLTGAK
jgi:hypothetical protein